MNINLISNHLTQSFQAISIRHFTPLQKKVVLVASILLTGFIACYAIWKSIPYKWKVKSQYTQKRKEDNNSKIDHSLNTFRKQTKSDLSSKSSELTLELSSDPSPSLTNETSNPSCDHLTSLPNEIKVYVISYLKGADLANVPLICKDFARVMDDESKWNIRLVEMLGEKKALKFFDTFKTWKLAYSNYIQMKKEGQVISSTTLIACNAKLIGEFSNGKLNGKGKKIFQDSVFEDGFFKDNVLHGSGKITWLGLSIEGEFNDGQLNGHAKITFRGQEWEGEFKKNKSEQQATTIRLKNDRIIFGGWFENRKLQGQATVIFKDNTVAEGEFKNGCLINGKFMDFFGSIKEGEFKDGDLVKGKFKNFSGTSEGKFLHGRLNGKGKFQDFNGKIFEGEFEDDGLIEGQITFIDGKIMQGEFTTITENDRQKRKLHNGTITYPNGTIEKYENGVIVT